MHSSCEGEKQREEEKFLPLKVRLHPSHIRVGERLGDATFFFGCGQVKMTGPISGQLNSRSRKTMPS
jgi:hypothetical protein